MKKGLLAHAIGIGFLQAAGVTASAMFGVAIVWANMQSIGNEPVGILLMFCLFAMADLFMVLAYPLTLVSKEPAQAFSVLRWTFLWFLFLTTLWILIIGPMFTKTFY